ncbi:hypothetical protein Hdeb2414_s0020g00558101 [Helianthus debilis subsp. tardiflorus]
MFSTIFVKSCKPLVVLLEGINLQCEWDLVKAISQDCLPVIASMRRCDW